MDPVAHTLVGAALAEAGLEKLSRYASATLIIGVNLPDLELLSTAASSLFNVLPRTDRGPYCVHDFF